MRRTTTTFAAAALSAVVLLGRCRDGLSFAPPRPSAGVRTRPANGGGGVSLGAEKAREGTVTVTRSDGDHEFELAYRIVRCVRNARSFFVCYLAPPVNGRVANAELTPTPLKRRTLTSSFQKPCHRRAYVPASGIARNRSSRTSSHPSVTLLLFPRTNARHRPMNLSSAQAAPIVALHGGPSVPSDYLHPRKCPRLCVSLLHTVLTPLLH